MIKMASEFQFSADEFAIYFDSDGGVAATELGHFLQRVATVARGQGAELHVVGLREGSLEVVLKAISRSKLIKNAKKEFEKAPIATSAAGAALVGAVVSAIIFAINSAAPTPLAKSAANLIENTSVTEIRVVTVYQNVTIMDVEGAKQISTLASVYAKQPQMLPDTRVASLPSPDLRRLSAEIEKGNLTGWIGEFDGELHFRPDGYRYSAPIDLRFANTKALPVGRYRVRGDLLLKAGRPDEFVILTAEPQ